MNSEQLAGITRIVVTAACTWLAARGFSVFSDVGVQAQVAAVVVGVVAVGWSFYSHTDAQTLKTAANIDPGIKITVSPQAAANDKKIDALVSDRSIPNITLKSSQ